MSKNIKKKLLVCDGQQAILPLPTQPALTHEIAKALENRQFVRNNTPIIITNKDNEAFPCSVVWNTKATHWTNTISRWYDAMSTHMWYNDMAQHQLLDCLDDFMSNYVMKDHPHARISQEAITKAHKFAFDPNTETCANRLIDIARHEEQVIRERTHNTIRLLRLINPEAATKTIRMLDTRDVHRILNKNVLERVRNDRTFPLQIGICVVANENALRLATRKLRLAIRAEIKSPTMLDK